MSKLQRTRVERFAWKILAFVGEDTMPESDIRNFFGNTPDVSKALRLCTKIGGLRRSGKGGRLDPFVCAFHTARATCALSHIRSVACARARRSVTRMNKDDMRPRAKLLVWVSSIYDSHVLPQVTCRRRARRPLSRASFW